MKPRKIIVWFQNKRQLAKSKGLLTAQPSKELTNSKRRKENVVEHAKESEPPTKMQVIEPNPVVEDQNYIIDTI